MCATRGFRPYSFSFLTAVFLVVQAATGAFVPGLYRDGVWVASVFRGQDVVALCLVVPLLVVSTILARRESVIWRVVWLGTLYKVFYNNLYYLTGADFNRTFLVYPAICVVAAVALIEALRDTDPGVFQPVRRSAAQLRLAAGIHFGSAAVLTVLWVGQSLVYAFGGPLPQIVVDGGGGTHLVAAFDLTCIVPPMVLGGVWLLQRRPWGVVVAAGMFVQGALIVADLIITPAFQAAAGVPDAFVMVPVWVVMGAGFLTGAITLLRPTR